MGSDGGVKVPELGVSIGGDTMREGGATLIGGPMAGAGMYAFDKMKAARGGGSGPLTDASGKPIWESILGAPGYSQYNSEANSPAPSAWATNAKHAGAIQNENELNIAANTAANSGAQADAKLAMSGGLSSGARERNAQNGQTNYLSMVQGANNNMNTNNANILTTDAQRKQAMKDNVLNMQATDILGKNDFYNKLWAANTNSQAALAAQADADRHSGLGGQGGFLGLGF